MRNITLLFIIGLSGLSACKFFEETSLPQQDAVNQKLVIGKIPSVDVLQQNGLIDGFDEHLWKTDTNRVNLVDWIGQLRVRIDSAGPGREYIYREFNPLDFSNSRFLQLDADLEQAELPLLQAELVDRDGKSVAAVGRASVGEGANSKKVTYRFEFPPSYFVGRKDKFDHTQVTEIRFYVHAAGDSFSGIIFLNELRALKNP